MKNVGMVIITIVLAAIVLSMMGQCSKSIKNNAVDREAKEILSKYESEKIQAKTDSMVAASKPPFGLKKFRLGMTMSEFRKLKANVTYGETNKYHAFRFVNTTLGGVSVEAHLSFNNYNDTLKLDWIYISAKDYHWSDFKDAIIAKYGSDYTTESVTKTNAFGASYSGYNFEWKRNKSEILTPTIRLETLGDKIDECRVTFWTYLDGQKFDDKKKENNDI